MKRFKLEGQSFDVDKVNEGTKNEMEIEGYRFSALKTVLTCYAVIQTGGLFLCLLFWKKSIKLRCTHTKCPLKDAHKILLKGSYEQEFVEQVNRSYNSNGDSFGDIYFINKNFKYIWQEDLEQFIHLKGLVGYSYDDLMDMSTGITTKQAQKSQEMYGKNRMVIVIASVWRLIIDEALNPFYIFQVYVIVIWMLENFYQYCVVIAICSVIAISYSVYEMRKSSKTLRDAIHSESTVTVIRDSKETQISSVEVVPGDVLVISTDTVMECDAVLLSGNCVVNESMLTGESVPVMKVPLTSDAGNKYQVNTHKKNTLFNGTKILMTGSEKNLAVVSQTSFYTAKGELVLTIMYPKPVDFQFYSSFTKFMIFLIFIGIVAMTYSAVIWKSHGATAGKVTLRILDILTFVVPPLLSAGLTFATGFAQRRLMKKGIRCISVRYICLTGGLDLFCFDKTGTLTDDSLVLSNIIPVENSSFMEEVNDISEESIGLNLFHAIAACHSLTVINGKVSGDSMDLELFRSTKWVISDSLSKQEIALSCLFRVENYKDNNDYIQVYRLFPFESKLQRMSVIVKREDQPYTFFLKGSPETVTKLCSSDTIPEDFKIMLQNYTSRGYRVLAIAYKELSDKISADEVKTIKRDQLEEKLSFLGLVVMENMLKTETPKNIKCIQDAGLRTVMATGDNIETAVHVARSCGMIKLDYTVLKVEAETLSPDNHSQPKVKIDYIPIANPTESKFEEFFYDEGESVLGSNKTTVLAMEGKVFSLLRNCSYDLFEKILAKSVVFARMLPDQKVQLIEEFQQQGYHVGMCGDGANDCGALKAAHSGIALSTEEASIASPFTSQSQSIACVPELLKEGRATLVSVFTVFNYQVSAFCFVALLAVLMLFYDAALFTDIQWVVCDALFIAPPLLFGSTLPADSLSKTRPDRNLISLIPISSLISFNVFVLSGYLFIYYYVPTLPEYVQGHYDSSLKFRRPDLRSSMLYYAMCFAYIFCIYIFSSGKPHHKPFYTNLYLMLTFVLEIIYVFLLMYVPPFTNYVQLVRPKDAYLYPIIIAVTFGGFFLACLWQYFFIEKFLRDKVKPIIDKLRGPRQKFAQLEYELSKKPSWPQGNASEIIDIQKEMSKVNSSSGICNNV